MLRQNLGELPLVHGAHLQHDAQLFGKQLRECRATLGRQLHVQPATPRKGHFRQRCKQAAIRTIVVSEKQIAGAQLGHCRRQLQQPLRLVEIGRLGAELSEYLRERRGAQPIASAAEIDQPERGVAPRQRRSQRAAHVL